MAKHNRGSNGRIGERRRDVPIVTVIPPREPLALVRQPVVREVPPPAVPVEQAPTPPVSYPAPAMPEAAAVPYAATLPPPVELQRGWNEKQWRRFRFPRLGAAALLLTGLITGSAVTYNVHNKKQPAVVAGGLSECSPPYIDEGTVKLDSCVGLPSKEDPNKLVRGLATYAFIASSANGDHVRFDDAHGYGVGVVAEVDTGKFYEVFGKDAKYPDGKPIEPKDLTPKTYLESVCGLSTRTHIEAVNDLVQLVEAGKKNADRISKGTQFKAAELENRQNLYMSMPYTTTHQSRPADSMFVYSNELLQAPEGAEPPNPPIGPYKLECAFPGAPGSAQTVQNG